MRAIRARYSSGDALGFSRTALISTDRTSRLGAVTLLGRAQAKFVTYLVGQVADGEGGHAERMGA